MPEKECLCLEVGERAKLPLPKGSKLSGGEWQTTGSAAVIDSEDLTNPSADVVGASVGKINAYYKTPVDVTTQEAIASHLIPGRMAQLEQANTFTVEVEVVQKKNKETGLPESPLQSSSIHEGLLPMSEVQEKPSANTPYGMDQENKPVAPHPSMTAGDNANNVARASEDAEATGPQAPKSASAKKSRKKSAKK
jgi:hypothetical protein